MSTLPTIYHKSVTDFRRVVAKEADGFHKTMEPYSEKVFAAAKARRDGQPHEAPTKAEHDAYLGCLMAGSYGYTLAAVLAVAAEFGPEIQQKLACVADDILINGDDSDRNADVMPTGADEHTQYPASRTEALSAPDGMEPLFPITPEGTT